MERANLGPAERIVQTLISYHDHVVHNRPGYVFTDASSVTGTRWHQGNHRAEEGGRVAYLKHKGSKPTRLGVLQADNTVVEGGRVVARYQAPGIFKDVAVWAYRQIAEVWKLDNEFSARWASYMYKQDHRDMKMVFAAFMLVQSRKGDPVLDGGKIAFLDEDFREVGEAMVLSTGAGYLDVKALLRIYELLNLPEIAQINREMGFTNSARNAFLGRFYKVACLWLQYREENPKMLKGLLEKGFRSSLKELAQIAGYKPTTKAFFQALRWKQTQAEDGRREIAIGEAVKAAETWADLTEAQICERIVKTKPDFKRITGRLSDTKFGLTAAIMAATIEAGSVSDKDLVISTPTLEELGLLKVPAIHARWQEALKRAEDQRALNVLTRVKSKEAKEGLRDAGDTAVKKAVEEVIRNMRVYFLVDVSSSMANAIEKAKQYLIKFLPGFPLDKIHVAVFNTSGREVQIKHASAAGVENAFRGISATGGTAHGAGYVMVSKHKPTADEDVLCIVVGDEEEPGDFSAVVRRSGVIPVAFGLIKVRQSPMSAVQNTAQQLGVPCFMIDERTFDGDAYSVPRTIRNLIAATPVGAVTAARVAPARVSLVDTILATDLLQKPAWAA